MHNLRAVPGNFVRLRRGPQRGIRRPSGAIQNQRTFIALQTLDHPAVAHQTLMVSEGEDIATAALLKKTLVAMGWAPVGRLDTSLADRACKFLARGAR